MSYARIIQKTGNSKATAAEGAFAPTGKLHFALGTPWGKKCFYDITHTLRTSDFEDNIWPSVTTA